jgi:hypothetical protein
MALQEWGDQACWLAPFVTHGTVGFLGQAYTGSPVSLVFQGEGSRLCTREERGAPSSCVCLEPGLTAKPVQNNGAWSCSGTQGWAFRRVQLKFTLPILHMVSFSSICKFGEGLLLTGYGTPWLLCGIF